MSHYSGLEVLLQERLLQSYQSLLFHLCQRGLKPGYLLLSLSLFLLLEHVAAQLKLSQGIVILLTCLLIQLLECLCILLLKFRLQL